jgi:GGDEF domain-containing protein
VSIYPRDAGDAEALMRHADAAMYQAKNAGRGRVRVFER